MEKFHFQSATSKSKQVSSSSEREDNCEIKCKKPRNYTISEFLKAKKMESFVSFTIYTSLTDDFTLKFDKKLMQLFYMALQFIKNSVTFGLDIVSQLIFFN